MNRLVLVRHGETEWNSGGRVQGSVDIPLSEKGRTQAEALAEFFARADIRFDRIYTSDLSRSAETGRIIAGKLGVERVAASPLLRELDCGQWEGRFMDELRVADKENFDAWRRDPAFPVPGGESLLDMRARAEAFFREEATPLDESESVLVVAHGLFNRMVLSVLMGIDPQVSRFFAQDNSAFDVFDRVRGRVHCTAWNILCHL